MIVVNAVFLCKTLTKKFKQRYFIKVDEEAIYDIKKGWICDCGHWTTGEDDYHVPVSKAERLYYERGMIR